MTNTMTQLFRRAFQALALTATLGLSAAHAGPTMYVHDSAGGLGTVDVTTGNVTLIGNMGVQLTDIAFDPNGNLYGISFTGLYAINSATAAVSFIGNHGINGGNALVFGADGTLYGAGNSTSSLFSINVANGASANLGSTGFQSGGDLAFNNGNLYLASTGNQLIYIDINNLPSASVVGSFGVAGVYGLATGDDNKLYAVANTSVYEVNVATGAATNGVSYGGQGLGTAYGQSFYTESGAEVPVPGSLALLGLGLAGLSVVRARKSA